MIAAHAEGATVAVRAQPNAKKNAVLGVIGGVLKVAVTAPPDDARANEAIVVVLGDYLGVKRSYIEIIRGLKNRNKVVLVRGPTAEELLQMVNDYEER